MGYHTNDALFREIDRLGAKSSVVVVGRTVQGREIPAVRFTRPGVRPQVLVTANLHGNEVIGSEVALGILERLAAGAPILDRADLTVIPAVNLDSREGAARALVEGRSWARSRRQNVHGVDLNRNFPLCTCARDVWYPLAGSRFQCLPWYRGSGPLSEPEARAVADTAVEIRPKVALNLHSPGCLFLYPYACTVDAPADLEAYLAMGRAFRGAQDREPYTVKQSRAWYAILGDLDDWMYDALGTLSVTVEVSRPFARGWRLPRMGCTLGWMNPPDPGPVVAVADACLAALEAGIGAPGVACHAPDR